MTFNPIWKAHNCVINNHSYKKVKNMCLRNKQNQKYHPHFLPIDKLSKNVYLNNLSITL